MEIDKLSNMSIEIDDVFFKNDAKPEEAVSVMSFTIAKYLYALGVSRTMLKEAMAAISKDTIGYYDAFDDVVGHEDDEPN